ncbi:MAG TPA: hypothetical protein VNN72_16930, partial [Polyangiaceae bacterium]|nr:hypothetical protein [Polyangiaceae bacterium]
MRLAFVTLYVLVLGAGLWLSWLNLRHQAREGGVVPRELEGNVRPGELAKIAAYTRDRARFGMLRTAVDG